MYYLVSCDSFNFVIMNEWSVVRYDFWSLFGVDVVIILYNIVIEVN